MFRALNFLYRLANAATLLAPATLLLSLPTVSSAQILQSFPFLGDAPAEVLTELEVPLVLASSAPDAKVSLPPRGKPVLTGTQLTYDEPRVPVASAILGDRGGLLFPDMMTPTKTTQFGDDSQPALAPSAVAGLLDARKRLMAQVAWGYIENNTNPETGLIRAVDGVDQTSLWDIASALAAIQSARELELLSKRAYDNRIQAVLRALLTMELSPDFGLPNRLYSTATLKAVNGVGEAAFDGTSGIDLGRLLIWLDVVRRRAPYFSPAIDQVVARWQFCDVISADGQLQFLATEAATGERLRAPVDWTGYEQYAAKGFALWGFNVSGSLAPTAKNMTKLLDVSLPLAPTDRGLRNLVDFETYALDGLEFAWDRVGEVGSDRGTYSDGWRAEVAHRLFQVQRRRWQTTGQLTARAPHYADNGRTFVYDSIALGRRGWQSVDITGHNLPGQSVISTRAAFAMWALWDHSYADVLFDAVADRYDLKRGFPEGLLENGLGSLSSYSLATNAGVLQALAFYLKGASHPGSSPITTSAFASGTSALNPAIRARQCLPPAPAAPIVGQLPLPSTLERCEDLGGGTVGNCSL